MLPVCLTAPLTRGENAVVDTDGGKNSYQFVKKQAKNTFFCCCLEFGMYLLVILSYFEEMLEKQNADVWKGFCFSLAPILYASVKFACLTERRSKALAPAGSTDKHLQHSGGHPCDFFLAASLHILTVTAAGKYLL